MAESPRVLPDRRRVAESFSRSAASYDAVAALQREVCDRLLDLLPSLMPHCWIDLGCGTGYGTRALARRFGQDGGIALDLAEGMLRFARAQGGARAQVAADIQYLPLREASCDLLFSSLALQWLDDLPAVLAEARRVLKPGGVLAFTSLVDGTLGELRDSWRAVDDAVHVNPFRTLADYQTACAGSGMRVERLEERPSVLHFVDAPALFHALKALGASNHNPRRGGALTGRARLRAVADAYERYRDDQGLPATYRVVYGVLRREED